jgi:hypothetical protein
MIRRAKNKKASLVPYPASILITEDASIVIPMHIINYKNSYDQFARKVESGH